MHRKYAKDGLAAVSVSLDSTEEPDAVKKVQAFLEKQHASFTNLLLDEPDELYREKLKITGPPCVFVFDREGQWTKFYEKTLSEEAIDKLVEECLKK